MATLVPYLLISIAGFAGECVLVAPDTELPGKANPSCNAWQQPGEIDATFRGQDTGVGLFAEIVVAKGFKWACGTWPSRDLPRGPAKAVDTQPVLVVSTLTLESQGVCLRI